MKARSFSWSSIARCAIRFAAVCALTSASLGCGGAAYQPKPLQLDREVEIDDEDIRKAFEARPQMPARVTVAYFSLGTHDERTLGMGPSGSPMPVAGAQNDAALETLLGKLPGVEDVYRIPAVAVTGEQRFSPAHGAYYGPPPEAPSIKKLRLIAARAHAEVLVVFDHGRQTGAVNELVAFAPLVLPLFFVPMFDARVESYLTAYVIDVRNGYFYGQVEVSERGGDEYQTLYESGTTPESEVQWGRLVPQLEKSLSSLLVAERRLVPAAASLTQPAALPIPEAD